MFKIMQKVLRYCCEFKTGKDGKEKYKAWNLQVV